MDKYVNLTKAKEELENFPCQKYNDVVVIRTFKKYIEELPAATNIREVTKSKWLFMEGRKFVCANCDSSHENMSKFCPDCGCEMELDKD